MSLFILSTYFSLEGFLHRHNILGIVRSVLFFNMELFLLDTHFHAIIGKLGRSFFDVAIILTGIESN